MQDNKHIIDKSKPGSKAIFKVYFSDGFKIIARGYKIPFFISILLSAIAITRSLKSKLNLYDFLGDINDVTLASVPSLLGFNLGAFALFIAFGGGDFLKTIVDFKKDKNFSIYQKNSAIFSVTILLQIITMLFAFVIKVIHNTSIPITNILLNLIINGTVLFFLIFLTISSIWVLKDIVVNIWNAAQMYHLNLWLKKQKEDEKK